MKRSTHPHEEPRHEESPEIRDGQIPVAPPTSSHEEPQREEHPGLRDGRFRSDLPLPTAPFAGTREYLAAHVVGREGFQELATKRYEEMEKKAGGPVWSLMDQQRLADQAGFFAYKASKRGGRGNRNQNFISYLHDEAMIMWQDLQNKRAKLEAVKSSHTQGGQPAAHERSAREASGSPPLPESQPVVQREPALEAAAHDAELAYEGAKAAYLDYRKAPR